MKRAFFFTFSALLLILLFYGMLQARLSIDSVDERSFSQHRVEGINRFINELDDSILPNILKATGKRTLGVMRVYINETGEFFPNATNFTKEFRNAIYTGRINGIPQAAMADSTIPDLIENITKVASDAYHINISITTDPDSLVIAHHTPFSIAINGTFNIAVSSEDAQWFSTPYTVGNNFSIIGMADPFFDIYIGGGYERLVEQTEVRESEWNASALQSHIDAEEYAVSRDAPSYLQRFYNSTNASTYGIESMINPDTLSLLMNYNRSYVDWLFFSPPWNCSDYDQFNPYWPDVPGSPFSQWGDLHNISGVTPSFPGFVLEDRHLVVYLNISDGEHQDLSVGGLTQTTCYDTT